MSQGLVEDTKPGCPQRSANVKTWVLYRQMYVVMDSGKWVCFWVCINARTPEQKNTGLCMCV